MIVKMNPQDEEVLDNNPDNNSDFDPDVRPEAGFDPEHNARPDIESDPKPGLVPDFEHVPRGTQLREELSRILSIASELESLSHCGQDPKNDYARYRRVQLQSRLSSELEKLQRYKPYLDKEVERYVGNLERIRSDAERLHLTEPMEYYLEAERLQQIQYYEAICDREAVYWTLKRVQAALGSSRINGFAVRDPLTPDVPIYSPSTGPKIHPGGLGGEVDGLLSSGPLDKNPRQR